VKKRFSTAARITTLATLVAVLIAPTPAIAQLEKQGRPDLVLTVAGAPDPVQPGGTLAYGMILQNRSPIAARDVVVTTTVPAGTVFASVGTPPGWIVTAPEPGASGDVTFSFPTLRHGDPALLRLSVVVPAETPEGTLVANIFTASSDGQDVNPADNTAATMTRVATRPPPTADLSIRIDPLPPIAASGGVVVEMVTIDNHGPQAATDVRLDAHLPEGARFHNAFASRGAVTRPEVGTSGDVVVTIDFLPERRPAIVTIVFDVDAAAGRMLDLRGELSASSIDPNPQNNAGNALLRVVEIGPTADLSLAVDDTPDPAVTGSTFVYTATVSNAGPAEARDVTAVLQVPRGARFSRVMTESGETRTPPRGEMGAVGWRPGTIPAGGSVTLSIEVFVAANGGPPLVAVAAATSGAFDPDTSNNTAVTATRIQTAGPVLVQWDPPDETAGAGAPPRNLTAIPSSGTAEKRYAPPPAIAKRDGGTVVGYNVYRGDEPDPEPTEENFYTTVGPTTTVVEASVAPGGSFFTVTAEYDDGESATSNSDGAGDVAGATLSSVKMKSAKVTATGSGFTDHVTVLVDGIPFVDASKVKKSATKVVQKGMLLTGQTLEEYTSGGGMFLIVYRNSDGGTTVWEYEK
jgi:uncharacterized repeat protein (TIGR01451 family)